MDDAAETLKHAAELLIERGEIYGPAEVNFQRIADIATVILGKKITRYDVAGILLSTKLGRMPQDPGYSDSYDDGVNYLAFMKQFRGDAE